MKVYHPLGDEAAEEQLKIAQRLVKSICDRTNQLLLLDSLYHTKNACTLLIPEEEETTEENLAVTYSCPIQHKAALPLHRRCAPKQAILALETTILQNFIISNRRGIFVYKDESEHVFYMKLSHKKSDAEETEQYPHMIELLVYGCDTPCPSITDQLVCLLQRKLLTLTLDALSSLLKKNPWFNLLASDLAFIKNFSSELRELDHDNPAAPDCTRTYVLPPHVQDPLILLLMFKQNICGSTFIQQLHHESSSDVKSDIIQVDEDNGEIKISFPQSSDEFQFYFNSSPSQLDPNYQPVKTLTEKGRQYSRQAGSGIAIIDVSLQHGENSECEILVGKRASLRVSQLDISLCANNPTEHTDQFKIRVEIINTTVDINVIHKWVELSLSQALAAWNIERHLESSRLGLLQDELEECAQCEGNNKSSEQTKLKSLNQMLPGLPTLENMICICHDLPSPAIAMVKNVSMLRATVLANLTLELLEAMLSSIVHKKKNFEGVDIIRYTEERASLVNITKSKNCARVELLGRGKVLRDKPTDSPEYIVVFGLSGVSQTSDIGGHLFFKQVCYQTSTQQETSAFSQALSRIKKSHPSLFQRHLVFILRVSRSARILMAYNANPQIISKLELRFKEIELAMAKADERCRGALQSRCLRHISFLPKDSSKQQTATNEASTDTAPNKLNEKKPAKDVKRGPTRRIPRPTSMLRPKLIGKSVEGAAMQAVAANRLRASSRPSIAQRPASGTGKKKVVAAPQRDKIKDKNLAGSHKKRRNSITKDAASTVRISAPQASLLKTYRAFFSLLREGPEFFTSQHRLNQSALQHLSHMFLMSAKEKGSTLTSTRLLCTCYGNSLGAGCIQQLQCDSEVTSANKFVDYLMKRWGTKMINPVSGAEDLPNNSRHSQLLYLRKDLLTSASRRALILMEVSMPWDSFRNSFIFSYRAWLFNSMDKTKYDKLPRKHFASLGSIEREAAVIEAATLDFIGQLNLEKELFHFACLRITRMARDASQENGPAALPLLKSVMARYCTESQAKLSSPGYRLQRRFLSPSSFLDGPLLDGSKKATLVEHLLSNCQMYNLTCIGSGDGTCFAGKMKVVGLLVYYFIAWHDSVDSALDVFVLCVTKGQCIDTYITKEGLPYAERILDVVLYSAMTTVQEMTVNAAKNIRKLHLWRIFGEDYSPPLVLGSTLIGRIAELRAFSYSLDIVLIDSRLETLLCDELNELQLSWRDAFSAITRSVPFSHCITYDEGETSNYIVYCKEKDMFLDFVLDQHGRMQSARMLAREQFLYDENSNTTETITARRAVQEFTLFLLHWMWIDCEISF